MCLEQVATWPWSEPKKIGKIKFQQKKESIFFRIHHFTLKFMVKLMARVVCDNYYVYKSLL